MSDARKRVPPVLAWLGSVDPEMVFLSVMTLGEIRKGIVRNEARHGVTAAGLRAWLDDLQKHQRSRLLPVTEEIALAWGRIAAGRSRSVTDGLIAATALVHGLTLVTRNIRDFADLGVPLVDPWAGA